MVIFQHQPSVSPITRQMSLLIVSRLFLWLVLKKARDQFSELESIWRGKDVHAPPCPIQAPIDYFYLPRHSARPPAIHQSYSQECEDSESLTACGSYLHFLDKAKEHGTYWIFTVEVSLKYPPWAGVCTHASSNYVSDASIQYLSVSGVNFHHNFVKVQRPHWPFLLLRHTLCHYYLLPAKTFNKCIKFGIRQVEHCNLLSVSDPLPSLTWSLLILD